MVLREVVRELLVGRVLEDGLLPKVGGQVGVSGGHGGVGSLGEVRLAKSENVPPTPVLHPKLPL